MSRWSAVSDYDYYDEQLRYAGPRYVERTCACCGETFSMELDGGPEVLRVWCPDCQASAVAQARRDERGAA